MVRDLIRNQLPPTVSPAICDDSASPATHVLPNPLDSSLKLLIENWDSISKPTKQMILKLFRLDLLDRETELLP